MGVYLSISHLTFKIDDYIILGVHREMQPSRHMYISAFIAIKKEEFPLSFPSAVCLSSTLYTHIQGKSRVFPLTVCSLT